MRFAPPLFPFCRFASAGHSRLLPALLLMAVVASGLVAASAPARAATKGPSPVVDEIRQRNSLRCGTNPYAGLALADNKGKWDGFSIQWCRALAAAVLGDSELFRVIPVESVSRFAALRNKDIDVLVDSSTYTMGRDVEQGIDFAGTTLYDGQGFIAHRDTGITSLRSGSGVTADTRICVIENTTSLENARDYLRKTGSPAKIVVMHSDDGAWSAFLKRRCEVMSTDYSSLALHLATQEPALAAGMILLPEIISKEPVGPAVREGDPVWLAIVRWTIFGLIAAEEKGLTAASVDSVSSADTDVLILQGKANDHAAELGLEPGWLHRSLKQVGNYGEIYSRTLGDGSPYHIARGQSRLWTDGGLLYAPPLR